MTMATAIKTVLGKYVTFSGRAGRSEFWYYALFQFVLLCVAGVLESIARGLGSVLWSIVILALFLPSLGVTVRRLHDTDRTGWWVLLGIVPIIGTLVLLIFYCSEGTLGPNRYGEDPRAVAVTA